MKLELWHKDACVMSNSGRESGVCRRFFNHTQAFGSAKWTNEASVSGPPWRHGFGPCLNNNERKVGLRLDK